MDHEENAICKQCEETAKQYNLDVIGLFGSRARGDYQEYSDYDLFIMGDIDISEELEIEATLQEAFGESVDVVRLTSDMDKFLAKNILNEGIVYYNPNKEFEIFYEKINNFFIENKDFIYFRKRDLLDK